MFSCFKVTLWKRTRITGHFLFLKFSCLPPRLFVLAAWQFADLSLHGSAQFTPRILNRFDTCHDRIFLGNYSKVHYKLYTNEFLFLSCAAICFNETSRTHHCHLLSWRKKLRVIRLCFSEKLFRPYYRIYLITILNSNLRHMGYILTNKNTVQWIRCGGKAI